MTDSNWIQIGISFASGGFAGQLLRMAWEAYQDRLPRLYKGVELDRIFSSSTEASTIRANVTVLADDKNYDFENLSTVRITILNRSRSDLASFDFGVTLKGGHELISVQFETQDRHHLGMITSTVPTPARPLETVDIRLTPLNRKDKYTLKLYIHSIGSVVNVSDLEISTSAPITWAKLEQLNPQKQAFSYMSGLVVPFAFAFAASIFGNFFYLSSRREPEPFLLNSMFGAVDSLEEEDRYKLLHTLDRFDSEIQVLKDEIYRKRDSQ